MTRRHALLLAALLIGLAAVMAVWLQVDRRPPEWDHANHLERALVCHRILADPGHDRWSELVAESTFYPPVVTCAAGLLYFVFPVAPLTAHSVMWTFLVVGTLAIYGTGRRLLDETAGLVAAFVFATAPFVVFTLLHFQLDLPLAAMVALTLYLLVRSEAFGRGGPSLVLGVVLGLGMLTKPPFAAYVLPPLLWGLGLALGAADRGRRVGRLLVALVIGALIALPWYGPRLAGLPAQVLTRSFKQAAEAGQAPAWSGAGLLFYPKLLIPQFGLLAAALFLWGLFAVARARRARGWIWAALLPWIVFFLIQNKNLRYTLPLLPAMALAAAAGLAGLRPGARRGLTWACVVWGAIQVGMGAFAMPSPALLAPAIPELAISRPPSPADWQHQAVLDAIRRDSDGREVAVAVVPNDNFFSVSNFRYDVVRERLPFRMTRAWDGPPLGVQYVIAKTGDQGPDALSAKSDRIMAAFAGGDPFLARAFPVIAEVPLPDGSIGMVRARRIEPVRGVKPAELARRLPGAMERALAEHVRQAEGLRITPRYRLDRLPAGEVSEVVLEARSALIGDFARNRAPLRVRELRLRIRGLLFNAPRLAGQGRFEVLDARSLALEHLTLDAGDLGAFLGAQRGLRGVRLALEDGAARVRIVVPGPDLAARVQLLSGTAGRPLALRFDEVLYGRVPLPRLLADWIVRNFDPTPRLARLPLAVTVGPIAVTPARLEVGAPPGPQGGPR
ncbi:MAG TPA: glycosyltransferase family 39 protein [Methylomirabilota bacterium]|nr:glycosyltransferase family 39 protein [Methylomirabilota bacterium]